LLRVIGLEQRGLLAQVLVEGALVGILGSAIGLSFGLLLADMGLRFFGGDLGGGFFRGTKPELVFTPMAGVSFLLLGLAAAMIGSLLPALEAARAQPAIALKNTGAAGDPKRIPAMRMAFALLSLGIISAFLPAVGGVPLFGYLSIGLLLFGGVAAMPLVARLMLAPLQRLAIPVPAIDLALKRLWGAPSQAAIALCGIVASTSLMIAMAVMVTSFRGSVDEWLTQFLPADVYLHVEADDSGLDVELQQKMISVPGVAEIDFRKLTPLRLSPELASVALLARSIDRSDPTKNLPMIGPSLPIPDGATPVWLSEPAVNLYGYRPGDWIALPIANAGKVFVAGMWRDYARQQGAIAMDAADYTRLTGDMLRTDGAVTLSSGAAAGPVIDAMRALLPEGLQERVTFAEPGELRALSLRIFDRSFAVTYVLEAIAILVGLAGVAATFSAQILARTKEFGMLRHVGVSRREIVLMLLGEGALLGAIGVAAGIGLGIAMSQVLIHVVNPQSFHWTMQTRLPLSLFAVVTAALIAAAAATALIAGRRALSLDAVRAVREDW
jgi:putative ABC transport system permease protein